MGGDGHEVIGQLARDLRPFIGRARELGELKDIWPGCRMLTLTGAGGIGKSRLAVELLRRTGGSVLAAADLSAVSDPALTLDAIAMALGLAAEPGVPQQDAIVAALRDLDGVLFLDTCEHVAECLRVPLQAILAASDGVRVLATSQVPLGVPGEATWRVPGLALAPSDPASPPAEAAGSDAVRFFLARAREHRPAFAADGRVLAEVAEICRRLDGIPLALGLAAGWMASVSPALMLAHWDRRAEMLRDPGAEQARHRTLAAAIEWSAALLTEPDRELAALVSVFAGPVTATDVAAVAPALGGAELLEGIRRLVEFSWLEFSPEPEPGYYRMLDPLRTWGLRQLAASGQAEAARRRHAEHFLSLCRQAGTCHFRADQGDWPRRLERAAANIQAALAWCASADPDLGADFAAGLLGWWQSGRFIEGKHWCSTFRESAALGLPRARVGCAEALVSSDLGAYRTCDRLAAEALPVLEAHGDALWAGRALAARGLALKYQGKPGEAVPFFESALAYQRQCGDLHEVANSLNDLGTLAHDQGDLAEAERYYRLSLDVKRELGDRREMALTMTNLADVFMLRGSLAEARRTLDHALRIARDLAHDLLVTMVQINLGEYHLRIQEYAQAEPAFREALELALRHGARRLQALAEYGLGCALVALGKRAEGREWLEQARREAEEMGDTTLADQVTVALTEKPGEDNPLSPRETEILTIAAEGLASKQIASRLGIEVSTVQTHLHRIYQKLQVGSRTAAVIQAQKLKLLPPRR
jgi:predicted ATPase/DNA-binding NarL/FixJ family response regulator